MKRVLRFFRHLWSSPGRVRRCFTPEILHDVQRAITTLEHEHAGEIRFVVEHALQPLQVQAGLTARQRALEVFGLLRVWDTEANNGILVYILFADHAVEILADRGIASRVTQEEWNSLCREVEILFARAEFRAGSLRAIEGAATLLRRHFPTVTGKASNELPDQPVLL
ncbi:MAG: hypothetical protein RLZZ200_2459 [Pseudomonadota bacterium]|jgi:uncharacterized membrane protein